MARLNRAASVLLMTVLAAGLLGGCAAAGSQPAVAANVIALKGPTGIGMVQMISNPGEDWRFTLAGSPDEIVAAIASGAADIAAAPTNLAATLYNKLGGGVRIIALNTLGVLHILERGETIQTVADLGGRTLYATGQGATPEYAIQYILNQSGVDASLEFKGEHAELATLAAADEVDLVMLPEPFATSLQTQNPSWRRALDVTELFNDAAATSDHPDATLSMGCVIARKEFVEEHPEVVDAFLDAHRASVEFVQANPEEAAKLTEEAGIMPSAAVVLKALPGANITFISGPELRGRVEPFFQILFDANPAAVGGAMPGSDFYYGSSQD
ncbi:MAG: ABC transporter substrate-binding protein [Oscillospiraceae bacterium]|jgi:NitT/TauT family transport system substrate-binding protein|nr:ABC transporter substrate-binding protein [Oscillospiraceae bacterium]